MKQEIQPYGKIHTSAEIGHLIRRRRKDSGLDQATAAQLAGVGVRFLSDIERGKATAEVGKVLQVLERMGLDVRISPRGSSTSDD